MPRMVIRSRPRRGRRAARRAILVPRCRESTRASPGRRAGRQSARASTRTARRREERAARCVRRPRKPSAEKLFLLPAFAVRLGARLTLRRVLRLRAHLVAHAVAVRVALLAGAGLLGFAMRRLHLLAALLAALGVLRSRAIETLAFACVGLRTLGIKGSTGRKQAGTEEGDRQFHKRVLSRRYHRLNAPSWLPLTGEV